jgi:hypothetical protein
MIVEHDGANAVARAEDAPGRDRGGLRRRHRLHRIAAAEEHRLALIDEQQRRAVALLVEHAHVRPAQPRRDLPVDRAHVVAATVVPDLLEVQSAAAHARRETAGQEAVHRLTRQERQPAAAEFERDQVIEVDMGSWRTGVRHDGPHAAATSAAILSIVWSALTPCDNAS